MMIIERNNKYTIWQDGNEYVLTQGRRREVMRGTQEEVRLFMERHPYGVPKEDKV